MPGRRAWAAITGGVVLVVASPALRADPVDGFPLSDFPMFAHPRERVVALDTAVGIDAEGGEHRLGPERIAGADEVVLAAAVVDRAVAVGPAAVDELCRAIAARIPATAGIVEVVVRTEVHDAIAWADRDRSLLDVQEHGRCAVTGP